MYSCQKILKCHSSRQALLLKRTIHSDQESHRSYKNPKKSLRKMFEEAWQFQSHHDLMSYLSSNIVHFEKRGVVVLNKPYGLPLKPSQDSPLCLEGCLKDLAQVLEVKELTVVKSASRFMSGCTILSTSQSITNAVRNGRHRIVAEKVLHENYLAVTLGHPKRDGITETIDVHMTEVPGKTNHNDRPVFEPVLARELMSRTKLKNCDNNSSFRVHVHSKTLSRSGNGFASLVSLQPSHNRRNFMQAYMADQLSPILGDQFFSYRVKTLMGHPTPVSHLHTPGVPTAQSLPAWMLELFGLRPNDEDNVPVHLHLFRVHLPRFYGNDKDLTVYAPPPPWFRATLDKLRLNFDFETAMSFDKVNNWKGGPPRSKKRSPDVEILASVTPDDASIPLLN